MRRYAIPLALFAIFAGLLLALLPDASAANVSFTLTSDINGWNFTEPDGSNPTLTVKEGDTVTITITWINSLHNWALYPGGTQPPDVEFGSPNATVRTANVTSTNRTASRTFPAPPPGTYEYFCEIHPFSMHGQLIVRANAPPGVTISSPNATTSWTGGTIHNITFTVADDEPLSGLKAWANYTSSAQSGTIVAGLAPSASNAVTWNTPTIDATDVRVNVTVVDSLGASSFEVSAAFEIDSTDPAVTDHSPGIGQTDVPRTAQIRVTFSEGMDPTQTAASSTFGVLHVPNNVWISGAIGWSADSRILTFAPSTILDALTTYRVHVNTTAEDDSDPGNRMLAPVVWNFVTGSATDTLAPTIGAVVASPSSQAEGRFVNITADVTDDTAVASVTVRVIGPDLDANLTMANAGGPTWYVNRTYATKGQYSFTVNAMDTSGNSRTRGGTFEIVDVTPPPRPLAADTVVQIDGTVLVTWSPVTATDLAGYHVYRAEFGATSYTRLTTTPIPATAPAEYVDGTVSPGRTYTYVVTSVDADNNESPFSPEATVTIPVPPSGPDPTPLYIAVGALVAIVLVALVVLRFRRRKAP